MSLRRRAARLSVDLDTYLCDNVHYEILAFTQLHILRGFPGHSFLERLASHLWNSLGITYSRERLDGKYHLFWNHFGPPGAKKAGYKKVYALGIECLSRLPEDFKEEVQKRVRDLETSSPQRRALRSASRTPASSRPEPAKLSRQRARLRLATKKTRTTCSPSPLTQASEVSLLTTSHGKDTDTARFDFPPTQISMSGREAVTPTRSPPLKREYVDMEINDSQDQESESGPGERLSRGPSEQSICVTLQSSESSLPPESPIPNQRELGLSHSNKSDSNSSRLESLKAELEVQESQRNTEIMSLRERCNNAEAELEILRLQKNNEILYLRERCDELEGKYMEAEAEYDRLHAKASPQSSGVFQTNDERLLQKNSQIRGELAKAQSLLAFSQLGSWKFPRLDMSSITKDLNRLRMESCTVLLGYDCSFTCCLDSLKTHDSIDAICLRAFGVSARDQADDLSPKSLLTDISIRSFCRCILSAALCEWVFEADLESLFRECDLLYPELRKLLASQSKFSIRRTPFIIILFRELIKISSLDVEAIRGFEFATLEAVLNKPIMDACIIPNRARLLARQLIQRLLPVIQAQNLPKNASSTIAKDLSEEEDNIAGVFKLALQIATRLLITTDMYRCVLHLPGTRVNSSMERDRETSSVNHDSRPVVTFTLMPGIQRCAADERDLRFRRFLKNTELRTDMTWEQLGNPLVAVR